METNTDAAADRILVNGGQLLEIMENIIRNLPLKQQLASRRTNKKFRDAFNGSTRLRRPLFLAENEQIGHWYHVDAPRMSIVTAATNESSSLSADLLVRRPIILNPYITTGAHDLDLFLLALSDAQIILNVTIPRLFGMSDDIRMQMQLAQPCITAGRLHTTSPDRRRYTHPIFNKAGIVLADIMNCIIERGLQCHTISHLAVPKAMCMPTPLFHSIRKQGHYQRQPQRIVHPSPPTTVGFSVMRASGHLLTLPMNFTSHIFEHLELMDLLRMRQLSSGMKFLVRSAPAHKLFDETSFEDVECWIINHAAEPAVIGRMPANFLSTLSSRHRAITFDEVETAVCRPSGYRNQLHWVAKPNPVLLKRHHAINETVLVQAVQGYATARLRRRHEDTPSFAQDMLLCQPAQQEVKIELIGRRGDTARLSCSMMFNRVRMREMEEEVERYKKRQGAYHYVVEKLELPGVLLPTEAEMEQAAKVPELSIWNLAMILGVKLGTDQNGGVFAL